MAGPVTPILDSFGRANESPIGGSWSGPLAGTGAGLDLNTNALAANSGIFQSSYWSTSTFGPDCEVYATITAKPGDGDNMELFARTVSPGASSTGYWLQFKGLSGNDQLQLYRTGDIPIGGADTSADWAVGDKMLLHLQGSAIEGWRYISASTTWSLLCSATDTTYTTAGYIGAAMDATASRFDDFGGGNFGQTLLPDADNAAGGWATAPLFSKLNDSSDATVITATAS